MNEMGLLLLVIGILIPVTLTLGTTPEVRGWFVVASTQLHSCKWVPGIDCKIFEDGRQFQEVHIIVISTNM